MTGSSRPRGPPTVNARELLRARGRGTDVLVSPVRSALSTHLSAFAMLAAVVTTGVMVTTPPPAGVGTPVPTVEAQSVKHVVEQRRDHARSDGWPSVEVEAVKTKARTETKTETRPRRKKIDLGGGATCDWGF